MIRAVQSIRGRTCYECRIEIPPGEGCIEFNSNSWYSRVACVKCVKRALKEAEDIIPIIEV